MIGSRNTPARRPVRRLVGVGLLTSLPRVVPTWMVRTEVCGLVAVKFIEAGEKVHVVEAGSPLHVSCTEPMIPEVGVTLTDTVPL
jgi:hypothetical protein